MGHLRKAHPRILKDRQRFRKYIQEHGPIVWVEECVVNGGEGVDSFSLVKVK